VSWLPTSGPGTRSKKRVSWAFDRKFLKGAFSEMQTVIDEGCRDDILSQAGAGRRGFCHAE